MIVKFGFLLMMAVVTAYSLWAGSPQKTYRNVVTPVFIIFPMLFSLVILDTLPPFTFYLTASLLLLLWVLYEYDFRYRWDWVDAGILAYIFWAALSSVLRDSFQYGILTFLDGFFYEYAPFLLVRLLISKKETFRTLFGLSFVITLLALVAPLEFYFDAKVPNLFQLVWPERVVADPFIRNGSYRVFSSMGHPIHAGMVFSVGLFLAFVAHNMKFTRKTWVPLVMMVICGVGIYTTISRTSYYLSVPFMAAIYFAFIKSRFLYGTILSVGLAAVLLVGLPAMERYSTQLGEDADEAQTSAAYRATLFNNYVPEIMREPVFGHGFWIPVVGMQVSIDNYYLFVLLQRGIPGLIIMLFPFILAMVRGVIMFFQTPLRNDQLLLWPLVCILIYYAVVSGTVWLDGQARTLPYMILGILVTILTEQPEEPVEPKGIRRWL